MLSVKGLTRQFSTASIAQKSLKSKLKDLVQAKDQVDSAQARRERKLKQKEKITRFQQNKINETELQKHLDDYFSKLDNVMNKKPEFAARHPAVYRYLGTTKAQLENPYMVSEEVTKLLKKNKLAKAAFVVRLAGSKGSVAMNQILQHLQKQNKHSQALKLFSKMKKWGARENEYTNISLSSTGKTGDTEKIVKTFMNAKQNIDENDKKKQVINANNTLKALSMARDLEALIQVFDGLMHKDKVTYTTTLNAISKQPWTDEMKEFRDRVWQEVEDDVDIGNLHMDARLMRAYINTKCGAIIEARQAVQLMSYFKLPGQIEGESFGPAEFDLMMKVLHKSQNYEKALNMFEKCETENLMKLDWPHYNYYVKCIARVGDVKRADKLMMEKFTEFSTNPPSTMYADLIGTFIWCDKEFIDADKIERYKKDCQRAWGKKLHIVAVDAYVSALVRLYQETSIHPRYGLKALGEVALSNQAIAQNLIRGTNVESCKHTVEETIKLGKLVFNHPAWTKHRFVWVKKMTEFFESFEKELKEENVSLKEIENFVYDIDTIVKRESYNVKTTKKTEEKSSSTSENKSSE